MNDTNRKWISFVTSCLILIAIPKSDLMGQGNVRPSPPMTGKYSVQWFVGGTKQCMVAVYAPLNYENGKPVAKGADVKIKIYRSYDGGKTYGTKGVKLVKQSYVHFTNQETGQNRFDPARINWINCSLEVPVDPPRQNKSIELLGQRADNQPSEVRDTTVYLAASAVVNGVESKMTNRFLTFSYAEGGWPMLTRYEFPNRTGQATPTRTVNVPSQVLADRNGIWDGDYTLTTYAIPEEVKRRPDFNEQGCQQAIQQIDASLGKRLPLTIKVTSMVPDTGQAGQQQAFYPGTADLNFAKISDPNEKQTMKADVVYFRNNALVVFKHTAENGTIEMVGNVLENATHYELHGPMRMNIGQGGQTFITIRGMWTVSRRK